MECKGTRGRARGEIGGKEKEEREKEGASKKERQEKKSFFRCCFFAPLEGTNNRKLPRSAARSRSLRVPKKSKKKIKNYSSSLLTIQTRGSSRRG